MIFSQFYFRFYDIFRTSVRFQKILKISKESFGVKLFKPTQWLRRNSLNGIYIILKYGFSTSHKVSHFNIYVLYVV